MAGGTWHALICSRAHSCMINNRNADNMANIVAKLAEEINSKIATNVAERSTAPPLHSRFGSNSNKYYRVIISKKLSTIARFLIMILIGEIRILIPYSHTHIKLSNTRPAERCSNMGLYTNEGVIWDQQTKRQSNEARP